MFNKFVVVRLDSEENTALYYHSCYLDFRLTYSTWTFRARPKDPKNREVFGSVDVFTREDGARYKFEKMVAINRYLLYTKSISATKAARNAIEAVTETGQQDAEILGYREAVFPD